MDNSGWERYNAVLPHSPPKKINKVKKIFRNDVLFSRPGLFVGTKVLKTKDGIIALIVYLFTGWLTTSLLLNFIDITKGLALGRNFLILLFISIFVSPIAMTFAYTAPLKNALILGLKKYPAYLAYNILILLITLALVGLMIGLTIIGLCLGLAIGLAILFYIIYRIFLAPGIIALGNKSPIDAIGESVELTRGWEGIWFFVGYFIVLFIVSYPDKYLMEMVFNGHFEALIIVLLLNIPLFIISVSITLLVASFKKYMSAAIETTNNTENTLTH